MQITTNTHANALSDLTTDSWRVIGVQSHGHKPGEGWIYFIPTKDIGKFHRGVYDDHQIIACKRYEDERSVVVAKLAAPENSRSRMR